MLSTHRNIDALTEDELANEVKQLEVDMRDGKATVRTANRLAEVKGALRRISAVRSSRSW